MALLRQAGVAVILVTLTLSIQCGGMAALINWGIAHFAREQYRLGAVRSAALMRAIGHRNDLASHDADPVVDGLLPLALFSLVGDRILLLDCQLLHRRLHRSCSPNRNGGTSAR